MNYLWLDLETTGLDPYTDDILEVGIIVTDALLTAQRVSSWLIPPKRDWPATTSQIVLYMHEKSGLAEQLEDDWWLDHYRLDAVENEIIVKTMPYLTDGKIVLAGSGVDTDMQFICEQMPDLYQRLAHYTLDVGVVRRFLRDICNVVLPELGPVKHRALSDVEHHLAEARTYSLGIGAWSETLAYAMLG